jgi:hypothetical protein
MLGLCEFINIKEILLIYIFLRSSYTITGGRENVAGYEGKSLQKKGNEAFFVGIR